MEAAPTTPTDLPQPPVTFWRDGVPVVKRVMPPYLFGTAVGWGIYGLLGWGEFVAMLTGLAFAFPFVLRLRNDAVLQHHYKRLTARADLMLLTQFVSNGLGMLCALSIVLHTLTWSQVAMALAPILIGGGIPLALSGRPRRVGTQRVCKFCDYEYTYGYPPETDPSAPHRCPECGKGWLGDLAVGVKRSSPVRVASGAACVLLGFALFSSPAWSTRWLPQLPTVVVEAMVFGQGSDRREAWMELSQRMTSFTAADHERVFVKLLDLRRESLYLISREQHAYMLQQLGVMPVDLQERFYRETFRVDMDRVASSRVDRTFIRITPKDGDYMADTLMRVRGISAGEQALPVQLEQAWPGLRDVTHYFEVQVTRDEIVVSVPRTDADLQIHLRVAVMTAPWRGNALGSDDPAGAAFLRDIDAVLPAK